LLFVDYGRFERAGYQGECGRIVPGVYRFRRTAPAVATNLGRGIALPYIKGDRGLAADPKVVGSGARLPGLLPEAAGGMKLSVDPKTFLLRVEGGEDFGTARPDWYFLTRWWVNGKPFLPQPVRHIQQKEGPDYMLGGETGLAVRLRLDAMKLGARPGDQVELQLLYCPKGWLLVENPQRAETTYEVPAEHAFPVLSNRVAFRVP
jgi:hypothetical protein